MATILVVDDDGQTVEQVSAIVAGAGHTPDFLLEAQYLLPKLETEPVDLILLDVNMPDVNGLMVLEQLKGWSGASRIPVIMITGESEENLIARCFDLGAVDFVHKPVRPIELLSRIKIALDTKAYIDEIFARGSALQQAYEFNAAVLDSIEDGLCVVDGRDFHLHHANRVFAERAQYAAPLIPGQKCQDIMAGKGSLCPLCPGPADGRCPVRAAADNATSQTNEHFHYTPDGKRVFTKIITTLIHGTHANPERVLYITRDVTARQEGEERLKHMAFHDALTGLPNRQLFLDRLEQAIVQGRRHKQWVAVLYFDLDRFKAINDTLGHAMGDLLLQQVARRLVSCVRESDTVARLGGDEFTAVLTNITQSADILQISHHMLDLLGQSFHLEEHEMTVTTSIGISFFPMDGDEPGQLVKKADAALYKAKHAGRNNIQFASGRPSQEQFNLFS
ncbi:MAG: diguanylate cyclase [Magnetococcales bacterium]|nr:diguanylate cyclase [Magnetococcales bacterium]